MQGGFTYNNPAKLYFGEDALGGLAGKLAGCGPVVMICYGSGSTVDYAIGVSASAYCEDDPRERCRLNQGWPECKKVPVGSVLAMIGTGRR